jgi:glycerol uptake facilitator-like aquaporin
MDDRRDLRRRAAAEAFGAFALVFAGCGATVTDAVHGGVLGAVGGPITGASMNPARSIGPALVSGELHDLWIYIAAPIAGAAIGARAYQLVRGEHPA